MNYIMPIYISSAMTSTIILKITALFCFCLVPYINSLKVFLKYKYYSLHRICFKKQYFLFLTKIFLCVEEKTLPNLLEKIEYYFLSYSLSYHRLYVFSLLHAVEKKNFNS